MVSEQGVRAAAESLREGNGVQGDAVAFKVDQTQGAAIGAVRKQSVALALQLCLRALRTGGLGNLGSQQPRAQTREFKPGARVGRRNGTHQIVDLAGRLGPVDTAVLGFATTEIAAERQILR